MQELLFPEVVNGFAGMHQVCNKIFAAACAFFIPPGEHCSVPFGHVCVVRGELIYEVGYLI